MNRRGWNIRLFAGLLALLVAGACFAQSAAPEKSTSPAQQSDSNACVSKLAGSSFTLNCARQEGAVDAHEERRNEREEADLVAQEKAADAAVGSTNWAKCQAAAAIIGAVFSALGLIGLYFTFKETQNTAKAALEANRIARDIGEAQTRPWICFKNIRVINAKSMTVDGNNVGDGYKIEAIFENTGPTPAVRVGSLREGFSVELDTSEYVLTEMHPDNKGTAIAPPRSEFMCDALSISGEEFQRFQLRLTKFVVHAFISYKIAELDPVIRVTEYSAEISLDGWSIDEKGEKAAQFKIALIGNANRCT